MTKPTISVVLPVYNSQKYIATSIQSVLDQTFKDFELIIINDGSTDNSENIILTFTDERIVYLKNKINQGLINSLNQGIKIAQGNYVARMDADDICIKDRFEKQIQFLEDNKTVAVVASTVLFLVDEQVNIGNWNIDKKTILPSTIRNKMIFENCIAHPSVIIKTSIIKEVLYNQSQKNVEDYYLWLRLLNRGMTIAKIAEPLLLYRIHSNSVTTVSLRTKNTYWTHFKMKQRFLSEEFIAGRINGFTLLVVFATIVDLLLAIAKKIKNLFK